jgi:hypothetical protein
MIRTQWQRRHTKVGKATARFSNSGLTTYQVIKTWPFPRSRSRSPSGHGRDSLRTDLSSTIWQHNLPVLGEVFHATGNHQHHDGTFDQLAERLTQAGATKDTSIVFLRKLSCANGVFVIQFHLLTTIAKYCS